MTTFEQWREERPEQYQRLLDAFEGDTKQAREAWCTLCSAAEVEAIAAERPRCIAHSELGFACGNLDLAIEGVESGASIASMADRYLAAALIDPPKPKRGMWDASKPAVFFDQVGARVQLVQATLKRWRAQGVA